ncbi:hypothetical protein Nm8I071_23910 [Nonomuraea sp. TT08I-71]|nr:hypothetical protein Nm8I071_23910 [Nonomuraea sp. TT08I-71]
MTIRRDGRRRWLVGAAVVAVVVAWLVIGFTVPPAADTGKLPQSITVSGAAYDRVHLVMLKTTSQDSVVVQMLATSQPIVVRASCRLAVLHTSMASSALGLEMQWHRTGANSLDVPDTQGEEFLHCRDQYADLSQSIDAAWLPRDGDQLRLHWKQMDALADTPSVSPASWAVAIYTAR